MDVSYFFFNGMFDQDGTLSFRATCSKQNCGFVFCPRCDQAYHGEQRCKVSSGSGKSRRRKSRLNRLLL